MAPGCKPGRLTPYAGSNPAPCTRRGISDLRGGFRIDPVAVECGLQFAIRNRTSEVSWAGVAQLVEHQPSKLRVASSNLVARSNLQRSLLTGFQLADAEEKWQTVGLPKERPRSSGVERLLGKEEVMSSNLIAGSIVTTT